MAARSDIWAALEKVTKKEDVLEAVETLKVATLEDRKLRQEFMLPRDEETMRSQDEFAMRIREAMSSRETSAYADLRVEM